MPLQHLSPYGAAIDVTAAVDPDCFGAAVCEVARLNVFEEVVHLPGHGAPDANAFFPSRVLGPPGLRVGDINRVGMIDVDSARPSKLCPLIDVVAVLIPDHDAVIVAISDEQASFGVERNRVWCT